MYEIKIFLLMICHRYPNKIKICIKQINIFFNNEKLKYRKLNTNAILIKLFHLHLKHIKFLLFSWHRKC